jgi:hypothetical protein
MLAARRRQGAAARGEGLTEHAKTKGYTRVR